jgi:hypothetical protein
MASERAVVLFGLDRVNEMEEQRFFAMREQDE